MSPEDRDRYIAGGRDALDDVAGPLGLRAAFRQGNAPDAGRRAVVLGLIDSARLKLASLARGLARRAWKGLGGIRDWGRDFLLAVGSGHFAAAMAATGTANLAPAAVLVASGAVDEQVPYYRAFRKAISEGRLAIWARGAVSVARKVAGKLPFPGVNPRFAWRSELYADPFWATADRVIRDRMRRDGFDEESWRLGSAERHCGGCPAQAAKGWVKLGTLPPTGSQECGPACRCWRDFRSTQSGLVVPSPLGLRLADA